MMELSSLVSHGSCHKIKKKKAHMLQKMEGVRYIGDLLVALWPLGSYM